MGTWLPLTKKFDIVTKRGIAKKECFWVTSLPYQDDLPKLDQSERSIFDTCKCSRWLSWHWHWWWIWSKTFSSSLEMMKKAMVRRISEANTKAQTWLSINVILIISMILSILIMQIQDDYDFNDSSRYTWPTKGRMRARYLEGEMFYKLDPMHVAQH